MTATQPEQWAPIQAALQARRPLWIHYHGHHRLVCPHALGWKNNRPLLLAYQTGGHTTSGVLPADPHQRWRCLYIDHIDEVIPADPASQWHTASNYNPGHPFPAIDTLTIAVTTAT